MSGLETLRRNPSSRVYVRVKQPRPGMFPMELLAWRDLPTDAAVTDILVEEEPELCDAILGCLCWGDESSLQALSDTRRHVLLDWKQQSSSACLVVSSAVPGEVLSEKTIDPVLAPELAIFLMRAAVDGWTESPAPSQLAPALRELGVYLPRGSLPRLPRFRCELLEQIDPPEDIDLEINPSASLQFDRQTPAEVDPFGSLSDVLDRDRPLLWQTDYRTGMIYPSRIPAELRELTCDLLAGARSISQLASDQRRALVSIGLLLPKGWARRQAALRIETAKQAGEQLTCNRYTVLENMIPSPLLRGLQQYISDMRSQGYLRLGDRQVSGRLNTKNNPAISIIHVSIGSFLEEALRRALLPSIGYLSIYLPGAELKRHRDRPQNEWNVSVMIDRLASPASENEAAKSPLKLGVQAQVKEIHLKPGDMAVYSGTQVPHWRDPVPAGQELTVCTYHFVERSFRETLQ